MTTTTTTKFIITIFILSLLTISPVCNACCGCTTPSPKVKPPPVAPVTPVTPPTQKCSIDTLKLGVCADVLGLVHAVLGSSPSGTPCCALLQGLADAEAALCLCTAIKANLLGLNLDVPITLDLVLSACQKNVPPSFQC